MTDGWSVRCAADDAVWIVESGGVRRAVIPVGGARAYRGPAAARGTVQCRPAGEWLVAESQVNLVGGGPATVNVRDVVRLRAGWLELHRSWWHAEGRVLPGVEFAIEVRPDGALEEHLIPGCLYDGNAGASTERLVPRLQGVALFEEHKCPTPMVYACCRGADGQRFGIGLLSEPCAVVDGNVADQWWSLGLAVDGEAATLMTLSGRLAVNGQDERIYDAQNRVSPYPDAWVNARPHHVYEKHIRLALQAQPARRWGWRETLHAVLAAQPALTAAEEALTAPAELDAAIRLKVGYALRRWHDDAACTGMTWHPQRPEFADRPRSVEYGWVGQNMRLAMCLWRWGRRCGDADLVHRGERCAAGWVQAAGAALAARRVVPTHYLVGKGWHDTAGGDDGYARPTTETLFELAEFCRRKREAGEPCVAWEQTLFDGLRFYAAPERRGADGLLPLRWTREGAPQPGPTVTAGVLLVAALAEAAALPEGAPWLDCASGLWESYASAFLGDTPRHPCGSALDSCCEDMESGMFLLISALRLAAALRRAGRTGGERLLAQAAQAADWVLTWTYTWNVPLQPGTFLASAGFGTRGWSDVSVQNRCCHPFTSAAALADLGCALDGFSTVGLSDVSVQNRHLHVFSVNAEILRLAGEPGCAAGEIYRRQAYRMLAPILRTISRPPCRWGMDEDGEQTEQYNQTNYIQHPWDPVCRPRGGIARWFVPWITVWVLSVCLDFSSKETS